MKIIITIRGDQYLMADDANVGEILKALGSMKSVDHKWNAQGGESEFMVQPSKMRVTIEAVPDSAVGYPPGAGESNDEELSQIVAPTVVEKANGDLVF